MASPIFAWSYLVPHETGGDPNGGLNTTPGDAGGTTKWGISQRSYPKIDIASLTEAQAYHIFLTDFWPTFSGINDNRIAAKVADLSFPLGPPEAVKIVQRALLRWTPGIKVDGVMGPKTLAAINGDDVGLLLGDICIEAALVFDEIATDHPVDEKFLKNWLHRAADLPPAELAAA